MPFRPPRCPAADCPQHFEPSPNFFQRRGFYWVHCRPHPIQRFRCKACGSSFSEQTFRADYRDLKPAVNARLIELIASGVGVRQCGRLLGLNVNGVLYKQRKIARTLHQLHENLSAQLHPRSMKPGRRHTSTTGRSYTFQLDEEESFEKMPIRALTIPIVIERDTMFIVATSVGPIRRLARIGSERRRRQDLDEKIHGQRADTSRTRVRDVLLQVRRRTPRRKIAFETDRKASYRKLIRQLFADNAVHITASGKAPRTPNSMLFPINNTIEMSRDNCSRLRRRSWHYTKTEAGLRDNLWVFTVYRNYVRKRFNRDEPGQTPAVMLGIAPRALSFEELARWRQDWGERSPCPLRRNGAPSARGVWPGRSTRADLPASR